MRLIHILLVLSTAFLGCSHVAKVQTNTDEPEHVNSNRSFKDASSYVDALTVWQSAEDLNDWIGARFKYDMDRAVQLSETQKEQGKALAIYAPSEFFKSGKGVCVDLSRFAFEALQKISPATNPKYLMIKFDPIQIRGNTLRLHWIVSFKRDDKHYFFADSKRPGYIAGPYNSVQDFIQEYSTYRNRSIIDFKELDSYMKKHKRTTRS